MSTTLLRPQFTRWGPKHDYRGALVALDWQGRHLLEEIREVYRHEIRCVCLAKITHFNGEPWPIEPALSALRIIPRRGE